MKSDLERDDRGIWDSNYCDVRIFFTEIEADL